MKESNGQATSPSIADQPPPIASLKSHQLTHQETIYSENEFEVNSTTIITNGNGAFTNGVTEEAKMNGSTEGLNGSQRVSKVRIENGNGVEEKASTEKSEKAEDGADDEDPEELRNVVNPLRASQRKPAQKQFRTSGTSTEDDDIEIGEISSFPPRGSLTRTSSRRKRKHTVSESSSIHEKLEPKIKEKEKAPAHQLGPDYVLPTTVSRTWEPEGAVKIPLDKSGPGSWPPVSVPTLLKNTAERFPDRIALAVKREGEWFHWTYTDYLEEVRLVAKAFIKLGLEPFHGVSIIGFNSPEWFLSNIGCIFAGGVAAGIYTTNNAESCRYVLANSRSNICVVENEVQLKKILAVKDQLPHLKTIIQYSSEKPSADGVLSWIEVLDLGKTVPDEVLETRLKAQAVNQCCTLIYTSGTTGDPKGVMLSHDNLTYTARVLESVYNFRLAEEAIVSYLPLSHVAAQMVDMYAPMAVAASTYFAQPDALKGSLVHTLNEVRPSVFFGVPRVWEKMYDKMIDVRNNLPGFKKNLFTWAQKKVLQYYLKKMRTGVSSGTISYKIADRLVFHKVRTALGLDQCQFAGTGAAPISKDVLEFFYSIGLPVLEVFGMSECSGPHCINTKGNFFIGSAGRALPASLVKIVAPDADGNGELCMLGRNVFMGYLNMEEKTKEALDEDGLLHSGDVAQVTDKGFVHITGRIKELLITAGGENVAPVPIEDNIKAELPFISNAMVIGDRKKFLSVLLSLKTEIDENMLPKEKLMSIVSDWAASKDCPNVTTVPEFVDKLDVLGQHIQDAIARANKTAVSNAQKVQKWAILPQDFSIPGGELGPTLKLKRNVAAKKYEDIIEGFYQE